MPKQEKIAKTKDPELWIQDYWNAWFVPAFKLYSDKQRGELKEHSEYKVKTFQDYVSEKEYYGQKCDLNIIPNLFLQQNNRLVGIHNRILQENPIDFNKLERVTNLARKLIYKDEK